MTPVEMVLGFFKFIFYIFYATGGSFESVFKYLFKALINLMRGPPPEKKEEEKPPDDFSAPLKTPALPASAGPDEDGMGGMLAILGTDAEETKGGEGCAIIYHSIICTNVSQMLMPNSMIVH